MKYLYFIEKFIQENRSYDVEKINPKERNWIQFK
jgi:hypothetical protein